MAKCSFKYSTNLETHTKICFFSLVPTWSCITHNYLVLVGSNIDVNLQQELLNLLVIQHLKNGLYNNTYIHYEFILYLLAMMLFRNALDRYYTTTQFYFCFEIDIWIYYMEVCIIKVISIKGMNNSFQTLTDYYSFRFNVFLCYYCFRYS